MEDLFLINSTADYRYPAAQSPLQGPGVMQPAAVYSKLMLRTIELEEKDYVFDGLAVERTMPSNNGANEIVFKRALALAAHTQPLVEGIPPASDKGAMVAIKASAKSYGRVMFFTDKVNWAVVDPCISEYTRQLAMKVPETKDILAQEALLAESQTFYAQPKTRYGSADPDLWIVDTSKARVNHVRFLDTTCQPTIDEFRNIVLSMEAAKVRPYTGSNFLALVSSAVMFDLVTDHRVKEFMKWTGTGRAYEQDVTIDLFNLMFKKAKTIKTDNVYVDASGDLRYLYSVTFGSTVNITLADGNTGSPATISSISAGVYTINTAAAELIDSSKLAIVVGGKEYKYVVTAGEGSAADTYTEITYSALKTAIDNLDRLNIHHSIVIGEEALYRVGVEGHTQPQFIKKEPGSAGTADPLNQRQSVGWKLDSLGYKVANPDAVVDYMSIPSQFRVNVNARPDLKNQFTSYNYGFKDASGNYYHPEQVMETLVWDSVNNVQKNVWFVKGTTTEVTPVTMTELVRPVASGRIDANGKKPVAKGDVPTMQFALKSNKAIRFLKDQVAKAVNATDIAAGKLYFIKGMEGSTSSQGTAAAEVVMIEPNGVTFTSTEILADGTGTESRTAIVEHGDVNLTGDHRVDDK